GSRRELHHRAEHPGQRRDVFGVSSILRYRACQGGHLASLGMTAQARGGVNPTPKDANPSPRNIAAMTRPTRSPMYTDLALYIDGKWVNGGGRKGEDVLNPATEKPLAHLPHASKADLDEALEAAQKGFALWRSALRLHPPQNMREGAAPLRQRHDAISK